MRITSFRLEANGNPLAEALRIDDLRSDYCEQLERRIAGQTAEINALRVLLGALVSALPRRP
ncbi:MAG: hypothetical protein ABSG41_12240 [Bryobacteraceae bacterium]